MSLVIYDGGTIHGVINIESSAVDLLASGPEAAQTVAAGLQTPVALLSMFH
jgi:hypothetical protein